MESSVLLLFTIESRLLAKHLFFFLPFLLLFLLNLNFLEYEQITLQKGLTETRTIQFISPFVITNLFYNITPKVNIFGNLKTSSYFKLLKICVR